MPFWWRCSRSWRRCSSRQFEQPVEVEMRGEMRRQRIEGLLDRAFVIEIAGSRGKALEPRRALAVVGKQAVNVSADDVAVGGQGAFRRSVCKPRKGPRPV